MGMELLIPFGWMEWNESCLVGMEINKIEGITYSHSIGENKHKRVFFFYIPMEYAIPFRSFLDSVVQKLAKKLTLTGQGKRK